MPLRSGRRRGCGITDLERGNPRRFAFGPSGFWFRLDRSAVVVTGAVASCNDLSGSGNHTATQATTTKRATYQATGIGPKGRADMLFDGVDDQYLFSTLLSVPGPMSFFTVSNKISLPAGGSTLFHSREHACILWLTGVDFFSTYLNVVVSHSLPVPATMAVLDIVVRNFNDVDLAVNGNVANRTSGVGYVARTGVAGFGADQSGVQWSNARVAEVIFLGNTQSKTAVSRIRRYLKAWHGIALV